MDFPTVQAAMDGAFSVNRRASTVVHNRQDANPERALTSQRRPVEQNSARLKLALKIRWQARPGNAFSESEDLAPERSAGAESAGKNNAACA
jgi:hypothetical protein